MHIHTHIHTPMCTNRHTAWTPLSHLIYSHFESHLPHSLQSEGQRAVITEDARRCMRERMGGGGWVGGFEWRHTPKIVLFSPFPSAVLIQPAELQTTTHTYLLLSILLGARWERKWLPAVLPPQGSFLHINTFTAWFHLSHTLKTHTQGKPGAVNDGHMQNCAHL